MAEQSPEQMGNKCAEVDESERQMGPVHRGPCGPLYGTQFGFVLI